MTGKTVTIPEKRLTEMLSALREIEKITRGLAEFNPTYETIHKAACEGLGIKEDKL